MSDDKNISAHDLQDLPPCAGPADLEDEFGFISDEMSKLPPPHTRFRGGKDAWTELEDWLRLEGLLH